MKLHSNASMYLIYTVKNELLSIKNIYSLRIFQYSVLNLYGKNKRRNYSILTLLKYIFCTFIFYSSFITGC